VSVDEIGLAAPAEDSLRRRQFLALAGDKRQKDLEVFLARRVADSVRHTERCVYMIASFDGKHVAVDLHFTLTRDDVVVLIERAKNSVPKVVSVHPLARPRRNVINDEVCRRWVLIEGEEAHADCALSLMHIGVGPRHIVFACFRERQLLGVRRSRSRRERTRRKDSQADRLASGQKVLLNPEVVRVGGRQI
jgi:hypothetical protein